MHRPGGGRGSVLGLCSVREGWVLGGSVLEMDAQSEGAPGGARTWVDSVRGLSPRELRPGVRPVAPALHPAPTRTANPSLALTRRAGSRIRGASVCLSDQARSPAST